MILSAGMTIANENPPEDTIDFIFYRELKLRYFYELQEDTDLNNASDHPALYAHFVTL